MPTVRELQEGLSRFRRIQRSREFQDLCDLIDKQVTGRQPLVFKALESHDELLGQEFMKGEIAGLLLIKRLPEIAIEDFEKQLEDKGVSDD